MADRNKEIRPARGVKIQPRKTIAETPSQIKPTRVVSNVIPSAPIEELPPPSEDAARVLNELNRAKEGLLVGMKEFSALLKDSKLPENRSLEDKRNEQNVVLNQMHAAGEVEKLSPQEGVLGVAIFAVRQALSLRDAGNRLAYEIYQLAQRIEKLERSNAGS